jgi:hypothetical protein
MAIDEESQEGQLRVFPKTTAGVEMESRIESSEHVVAWIAGLAVASTAGKR